MNITERNFYRLLRAGAFATDEQIEPLSAWKWNRLYQMAEMHDVVPLLQQGIERCQDQFALQSSLQAPPTAEDSLRPGSLPQSGEVGASFAHDENPLLDPDHLTNPLLDRRLQAILDREDSNTETRTALLHLIATVRFIMNAGIPVKCIIQMGIYIRQSAARIDAQKLQQWVGELKLEPMARLAATMMVSLLHFQPGEIPFLPNENQNQNQDEKSALQSSPTEGGSLRAGSIPQSEGFLDELLRQKNSHAEEWYFAQGKDIFVHTSNPAAMMWSLRRSIKLFRFYPAETVTNFFTSFAHSLSHIEE